MNARNSDMNMGVLLYALCFRVQGLGFRVYGLGFRVNVECLVLSVWGLGFRVKCSVFSF
jgi:hypothetical protein